MPVTVRKSALLLFFCFIFSAGAKAPQADRQSPTAEKAGKAVKAESRAGGKKSTASKNRKPGGTFKGDLLSKGYYKPVNSAEVRARILQHISAVEQICKNPLSAGEKAGLLVERLTQLNNAIDFYLKQPYLLTPDRLFLQHIKENISPVTLSFGRDRTYAFARNQELDWSDNFLTHYYGYFNIEEGEGEKLTAKGLKDEWAVKIYKALTCLKI